MNTFENDTGIAEDLKLTISSVKDSRCPENEGEVVIACAWEGEARAKVSLEHGDTFELVKPRQGEGEENTVVFEGYKLTLLDVIPFPKIEEPAIRHKTVQLLLERTP
jgi:hypothetical protein